MSATDPFEALRASATAILHDQHAAMREIVRDLNDEGLNWLPAGGDDVNSICQMLSHALEAERFLIATAVGATIERNREAQFATRATAADMLALIDRTEGDVERYLADLQAADLAREQTRTTTSRGTRAFNGAWWLLHAVEHSREHVGQALLTRQLYEQQA